MSMKRIMDIFLSTLALIAFSPVIAFFSFLVWLQDRKSPFYIAPRVGKKGVLFRMIKLRSMTVDADSYNVNSTSEDDARITSVGKLIRKYKIDELVQLVNVLKGDMSLVGPRPNVLEETKLYTTVERRLLNVSPGITDIASIVFADEGSLLKGSKDPDATYAKMIRPWKSRLGLIYIEKKSFALDLTIILLTVLNVIARRKALDLVSVKLQKIGVDDELVNTSLRNGQLKQGTLP